MGESDGTEHSLSIFDQAGPEPGSNYSEDPYYTGVIPCDVPPTNITTSTPTSLFIKLLHAGLLIHDSTKDPSSTCHPLQCLLAALLCVNDWSSCELVLPIQSTCGVQWPIIFADNLAYLMRIPICNDINDTRELAVAFAGHIYASTHQVMKTVQLANLQLGTKLVAHTARQLVVSNPAGGFTAAVFEALARYKGVLAPLVTRGISQNPYQNTLYMVLSGEFNGNQRIPDAPASPQPPLLGGYWLGDQSENDVDTHAYAHIPRAEAQSNVSAKGNVLLRFKTPVAVVLSTRACVPIGILPSMKDNSVIDIATLQEPNVEATSAVATNLSSICTLGNSEGAKKGSNSGLFPLLTQARSIVHSLSAQVSYSRGAINAACSLLWPDIQTTLHVGQGGGLQSTALLSALKAIAPEYASKWSSDIATVNMLIAPRRQRQCDAQFIVRWALFPMAQYLNNFSHSTPTSGCNSATILCFTFCSY